MQDNILPVSLFGEHMDVNSYTYKPAKMCFMNR